MDAPNGGMVFSGAGTTQAYSLQRYGGIIYAYTEKEVLLWRPNNSITVYIGERWGSGQSSQSSATASVIIKVYYLPQAGI